MQPSVLPPCVARHEIVPPKPRSCAFRDTNDPRPFSLGLNILQLPVGFTIGQPCCVISVFPNSIILRPGDEKNVEAEVKSVALPTRTEPKFYLHTGSQPTNMNMTLTPDKTIIPFNGIAHSLLQVNVSSNAIEHPSFTLPLSAEISIPSSYLGNSNSTLAVGLIQLSWKFVSCNNVMKYIILKPFLNWGSSV